MAKQIIVLQQSSNGTQQTINCAFWFDITSGAAAQTNGSAWGGASSAENSAVQAGTVLEEVRAFAFPAATPATAIKAVLQQAWTERNTQIGGIGPNVYDGVYLDPVAITTNGGWSA